MSYAYSPFTRNLDYYEKSTAISGTITNHGDLEGLSNDDHSQYHTDARGNIRYYTKTLLNTGQLDNRYYTETELNAGQLDNRYYTESEVDALTWTESDITDLDKYTQAEVDAHNWLEADITDLDKYTQAEVDTISGSLQINIDGKSDTVHTHDDRYYTETELNAGQLDNRYYTESEVDALTWTESDITDLDHDAVKIRGRGISSSDTPTDGQVITWDATVSEWNYQTVAVSGGGTTNHSELNQLDYASAEHTGFASQDQIDELLLVLKENNIYVGEIVFNTSGQTFAPVIILSDTATVLWTFSDETTSDSTTPNKDFGSAGNRVQRLKVTPWANLYRINIGYDAADGGAGDIELIAQQNVTSIKNLYLVADTLIDFCGNHNPITDLNFNNFILLDTIELYGSDLESITIKNTPLIQRLQVESTDLAVLDLSETLNLGDVRASSNPYTSVNWGTSAFDNLWHICMRDTVGDYRTIYPTAENMSNIEDLFIWNTNQTGAGSYTNLTSLRNAQLSNNSFTSLDFTNSFAINSTLDAHGNTLTSTTLSGCSGLDDIDLSNNNFNQTNIDYILTTIDTLGNTNGDIDLTGTNNSYPGSTGVAAISSLEGKGWTCDYTAVPAAGNPVLNTATIGVSGINWTFAFDKNVTFGVGGSGGFDVTMVSGGAIDLTYVSGDGTSSLVYSGSPTVSVGDTVSSGLDYVQPGDGIEETVLGDDLLSLSDHAVVNNTSGGDAIAFVDSCEDYGFQGTPGPTTSMNFIVGNVVAVNAARFGTQLTGVSDTLGNTYHSLGAAHQGQMYHDWYYCVVASGGAGTVSATPFESGWTSVGVMQFSNVDTTSPLGASIVSSSTASVAITTTNADDVILFGGHNEGGPAVSYTPIPAVGPVVEIENLEAPNVQGRPTGYWITTEAQTSTLVGCTPQVGSSYSMSVLSLKKA